MRIIITKDSDPDLIEKFLWYSKIGEFSGKIVVIDRRLDK